MVDTSRALQRSNDNKIVAGVLAGLADYFDMDPTLLRVIYVVVSVVLAAFPGILVYAILWFLMPETTNSREA